MFLDSQELVLEQMELEFFVKLGSDVEWHRHWVEERMKWWRRQGLASENLVPYEQKPEELAHYARATVDILYRFPHGVEELEGVANRTDFDLGSHTRGQGEFSLNAKVEPNGDSTQKLAIQDRETNEFIIPFVIEPSAGVDRGLLAVLTEAYTEEEVEGGKSKRTVLKLKPHLSPFKAAVIPLARNNADIMNLAREMRVNLQSLGLGRIGLEDSGNVGKSYRRHDEIGTPLCITVDFDTIGSGENSSLRNTVTVRDRDSMQQERVSIGELDAYLRKYFR